MNLALASLASDGLDFLLVAGLTAVVLFVASGLVLWLTAWARKRRHAAEALSADAGRDDQAPTDVEVPGRHGLQG